MNPLKYFFSSNKKIIENSFFGQVTIQKLKHGSFSYSCIRHFMPVKYKISIFLEGKNNDNFSFANSFFRKIESSYPEVITAITPLLEDTLQNWKENFKIKDFKQEFQIVSLSIPIQKEDSIIWEITFETIHDPNHQFTVGMSDMEAKWLNIDG